MVVLIAIILNIFLITVLIILLVKFSVIKKHSAFDFFTWHLLFCVISTYAMTFNQNLKDWADLWVIFAIFYFTIFELKINIPE